MNKKNILTLYTLGKIYRRKKSEPTSYLDFYMPIILEYINSKNPNAEELDDFLDKILTNKLNRSVLRQSLKKYMLQGTLQLKEEAIDTVRSYSEINDTATLEFQQLKQKIKDISSGYGAGDNFITEVDLLNMILYPFSQINEVISISKIFPEFEVPTDEKKQIFAYSIDQIVDDETLEQYLGNLLCSVTIIISLESMEISQLGEKIKQIPVIYIDNMFIGRLFHWCNPWQHSTAIALLEALKKIADKVKVYSISLDAILTTIESYNHFTSTNSRPDYNTVFYHIRNSSKQPKIKDINNYNLLSEYIINNLGIEIDTSIENIPVDQKSNLYSKILKIQKDPSKSGSDPINPVYTEHAFKIVTHYTSLSSPRSRKINDYKQIFLTYAKAISWSYLESKNNRKLILDNLMWAQNMLFYLTLSNFAEVTNKIVDKLTVSLIVEYYGPSYISKQTAEHLAKLYSDSKLSDEHVIKVIAKSQSASGRADLSETKNWDDENALIIELEHKDRIREEMIKKQSEEIKKLRERVNSLEESNKTTPSIIFNNTITTDNSNPVQKNKILETLASFFGYIIKIFN